MKLVDKLKRVITEPPWRRFARRHRIDSKHQAYNTPSNWQWCNFSSYPNHIADYPVETGTDRNQTRRAADRTRLIHNGRCREVSAGTGHLQSKSLDTHGLGEFKNRWRASVPPGTKLEVDDDRRVLTAKVWGCTVTVTVQQDMSKFAMDLQISFLMRLANQKLKNNLNNIIKTSG